MENKGLETLIEIRKKKHLTRDELSEISGVPAITIKAIEKGNTNPNEVKLSTLISLCRALHIKLKKLYPELKEL